MLSLLLSVFNFLYDKTQITIKKFVLMKVNGPVLNYQKYFELTQNHVANHQTSGSNQSEALIGFTALNLKRMERLNKTLKITAELQQIAENLSSRQTWYVISENWCGDCAQNLPAIQKIVEHSKGKIELKIVFRDENPELMEIYHTNGAKSIPKLIAFDENKNELFTWGARPKEANEILYAWKANPQGKSWEDFEKELHLWYARDKAQSLFNEFYTILSGIN